MYVSSLPISAAAAAANAVRAAIMRRAHDLVRLNSHLKNTYTERFRYFLAHVWKERKERQEKAAALAARQVAHELTVARHRKLGLVTWLVGDGTRCNERSKPKAVVAYTRATNKKHFVTIPHDYRYTTANARDYRVNLVSKMKRNVVYGRVDERDNFDYIMLNEAGDGVVKVYFDNVAHLVPAVATPTLARPPAFRFNPRTGANVYASSYDDDYRDEAFAGTPYYKDDEPLFEPNDFMPEDSGGYE